jgi:hypothetical protein
MGVWADLVAGLDRHGKSHPEWDSIPWLTLSHYLNYAILTTQNVMGPFKVQVEQSILYPKCLGLEVSWISDFGILAYNNETAWGWEPNLNAKSIYVSHTAYECIGFI